MHTYWPFSVPFQLIAVMQRGDAAAEAEVQAPKIKSQAIPEGNTSTP